jgi:hypothetical protein
MINLDEDSLICDFAEYYRIYDYTALPAKYAGVLACGLRENSRIKMKMSEQSVDMNTLLLATIADRVQVLVWQNTEDGQKGRNIPESITEKLLGRNEERDHIVFETGADFEAYRERLINGKWN